MHYVAGLRHIGYQHDAQTHNCINRIQNMHVNVYVDERNFAPQL